MDITACSYTDIGGRDCNEDSLCLVEDGFSVLAVVADGLGGHAGGERASRAAASVIGASLSGKDVSVAELNAAIQEANSGVLACACGSANRAKTTLAVLWMRGHTALAATVGDTRIYQFRHAGVRYQSKDHTIAQVEADAGSMSKEDIRTSPYRHHLTRALGGAESVRADIVHLDVEAGDALLVCSDGVWGELTEAEMAAELVRAGKPADWLKTIREIVTRRAGERGDNHSAIAVFASEARE